MVHGRGPARVAGVDRRTQRRLAAAGGLRLLSLASAGADEFRVQGKAAFDCQVVSTDELAAKTLDDFAAVCLVDPRSVAPAVWQKLRAYVAAGGGLGIFLGRNAVVADFNEAIAQSLMPGKLVRQWRGDTTLAPDVFEHPVLAKFRRLETAWELLPVFRHWQLGDLADGATAVLSYADNQPRSSSGRSARDA